MYRDYKNDVDFFYVYKRLAHPETNNFIEVANLQERLMHIAEAKRMTGTEIPWLADAMDDRMTKAFGGPYNGEFVVSPEGKVIRQRFWSNPTTLRKDLEELVGPVEHPTSIQDLPVRFRPEPRSIASGVVTQPELPRGLSPIQVEYVPLGQRPLFVKLRAEWTDPNTEGERQIYLGFYVDPIHKVHWNNGAGPVELEIDAPRGAEIEAQKLVGPKVAVPADVDPRMFLVDAQDSEDNSSNAAPIRLKLRYVVCDDAETFCDPLTQEFIIRLKPLSNGSTRPGIFLNRIFSNVTKFDKNGDHKITPEELGEGNVTIYMTHLDYNLDNVIDEGELARFNAMYRNGKGIP